MCWVANSLVLWQGDLKMTGLIWRAFLFLVMQIYSLKKSFFLKKKVLDEFWLLLLKMVQFMKLDFSSCVMRQKNRLGKWVKHLSVSFQKKYGCCWFDSKSIKILMMIKSIKILMDLKSIKILKILFKKNQWETANGTTAHSDWHWNDSVFRVQKFQAYPIRVL